MKLHELKPLADVDLRAQLTEAARQMNELKFQKKHYPFGKSIETKKSQKRSCKN